ncbi:MAG: hypothetical protein ACOCXA_03175 [Planctomycetota bacterium]
MLAERCLTGITADGERCRQGVHGSTALLTALMGRFGYQRLAAWAQETEASGRTLRELILDSGEISSEELDAALSPEMVNRLGSLG